MRLSNQKLANSFWFNLPHQISFLCKNHNFPEKHLASFDQQLVLPSKKICGLPAEKNSAFYSSHQHHATLLLCTEMLALQQTLSQINALCLPNKSQKCIISSSRHHHHLIHCFRLQNHYFCCYSTNSSQNLPSTTQFIDAFPQAFGSQLSLSSWRWW